MPLLPTCWLFCTVALAVPPPLALAESAGPPTSTTAASAALVVTATMLRVQPCLKEILLVMVVLLLLVSLAAALMSVASLQSDYGGASAASVAPLSAPLLSRLHWRTNSLGLNVMRPAACPAGAACCNAVSGRGSRKEKT